MYNSSGPLILTFQSSYIHLEVQVHTSKYKAYTFVIHGVQTQRNSYKVKHQHRGMSIKWDVDIMGSYHLDMS